MSPRAFISGLAGPVLSGDERSFLAEARPWGVILFARNVETSQQVRRLCDAVRAALGRDDAPILIDQEGGRVQRIGPPAVRAYPPGAVYGRLYARDPVRGVEAARLGARLIGMDLLALGISVDCIPLLDVPAPGSSAVIGERAYGGDVRTVAALGGAVADGLADSGVLPVMKHMPGHGRAEVDSHAGLPVIDATIEELERTDFVPFRLHAARIPLAMTAHVVLTSVDPSAPATLSSEIIGTVIRGRIGYRGALMTDDISMGALSGSVRERASGALAAGCDLVLHCNGALSEMEEVASASPELHDDALARTEAALAWRKPPQVADRAALEARFDALLSHGQ